MIVNRPYYLKKLIDSQFNGRIKVITGIRRCGKSTLLFDIFYNYLLANGIDKNNIILIKLDATKDYKFRNPFYLSDFVENIVSKNKDEKFYLFIDEVQLSNKVKSNDDLNIEVDVFDMLNGFRDIDNLDTYVTGSNSTTLSKDIDTRFKDRGYQIHMHPLSFKELYDNYGGDKHNLFNQYLFFGGMPHLLTLTNNEDKQTYLKQLLDVVYVKDIIDRYNLRKNNETLLSLLSILASSVGSLTNPSKLSNSFNSIKHLNLSTDTIDSYLEYFANSFLINPVRRFNVSRNKFIDSPIKYYYEDIGLRNAQLDFMNNEVAHIMENIIYNELNIRGFSINICNIEEQFLTSKGSGSSRILEIDFCAVKANKKFYIQSSYSVDELTNKEQETRGLKQLHDSFKKIIIVRDSIVPHYDENGIYYIGIEDFLLDDSVLI